MENTEIALSADVTRREYEVLGLLSQRLSNREIADRLYISVRTVESHVSSLLTKLGARSRLELIAVAQAHRVPRPVHNLSRRTDSFVGREDAVTAVASALEHHRLITIVGPPGVGKTRLAVETAVRILERWPGGVWEVELAGVSTPDLVVSAVLAVLGVTPGPGVDPLEALTASAPIQPTLVLLDNCEHVTPGAAKVAAALVTRTDTVWLLATSRHPLGVPGELVFGLDTLPADQASILFCDRLRSAVRGLDLDREDETAVTQIVERLDGIPLALELAASRVRAFQPREMIDFLDVAVGLNPDRGPDDRQRTLYQAIAWSYRLLNAEQQALLRRLTVFAGSFTLDAAVQVAADHELEGADVVRLLPELIDHSLVEVRRSGSSTRYRILEAIRTFAAFDDSDRGLFADRHSGYFAKLVAEAESQLRGPGQHRWLQFLDDDIDNLRLALANSLASGNVETAWGLIEGSVMFWEYSGRRWEGVEWVRKAFAADTGAVSRTIARGQAAAAWMLTSHDTHETRSAAEKAMATADAVGDSVAYQRARVALGWTLAHYRRAEAAAMLAEAASFFASQGERWWQSFALIRLGSIQPDGDELERGGRLLGEIGDDRTALMAKRMFAANLVGKNKPEAAFRVAEEGLHLAERMGSLHDRGEFLRFQAAAHMLSDRLESADELFSEAIPLLQKSGDLRCSARSFAQHGVVLARLGRQEEARTAFANAWELASAVYDPSVLHLSLRGLLLISDDETAVALQAAAERIRQSADISVYPGLATDQHMTEVRSRLDPAVYLSAWERGTTLDPLEIVQGATAARPQRR